jgi:hypothetical protein
MKDNSLFKVGGTAAFLMGIMAALVGITYMLLPPDQRLGVPAARILPSIAQGAMMLQTELLEMALIGVLGLAAVPAISELVRAGHDGWVRWMSNLAFVGFAVMAVSNVFTYSRLPGLAAAFVKGDPATQAALVPVWRSSFDLLGFWGYGAVGLWILVVSLVALQGTSLPKGLAYLGILTAVLNLLIPVGFLLKQPPIFLYDSILGGLASCIWFIWAGLVARRYVPGG